MTELVVRHLIVPEISLIAEIDRTEHVTAAYRMDGDALVRSPVDWRVPPWSPDGTGPHHVATHIEWVRPIVEHGGIALGAFRGERFAGIGVVVPGFEPPMAWLAFLHVTRPERGNGVGTALWEEAARIARERGATSMYVSATPSAPTVEFYLRRGCRLADPPHAHLLTEEPEDIHFVCTL